MVLTLFPIFNPVIVIYFTDEYKKFLFSNSDKKMSTVGVFERLERN